MFQVSCLSDFKNLERLDLSFNNLTSLEGLKSCVNLKWLSVVQNKLQSLKGIEGLSKLTVLNAGKNKLRSMAEVGSLASLRALILNDNEIVSICRLDQMKDLNTLVLSRNPIREIGESLLKMKSLTKLSLSNCQVESVGLSLQSCAELKELRLSHNDIKALPAELGYNKKLQNLDLGNNLITRWSDFKVLNSLVSLRNLNLQGNPIAENDKLAKKVRNSLPNLHVFNARPIDKGTKNDKGDMVDDSKSAAKKHKVHLAEKRDHIKEVNSKGHVTGQNEDNQLMARINLGTGKELKRKRNDTSDKLLKKEVQHNKEDFAVENKLKKKSKENQCCVKDEKGDGHLNGSRHVDMEKGSEQERNKTTDKCAKKEVPVNVDSKGVEKKKKKRSKRERGELDVIDDGETSFADLFSADIAENPTFDGEDKMVDETLRLKSVDGSVATSAKRKKSKNKGMAAALELSQGVEVGLGGPSTWGDD
ncbi:dynein assembly factor 1, axonemal homolog [Pistacia vera]|uniref:dynein assembly factor 1, axonemal homolog n=1 Tax=Pistacia vera TaxID=55513 RepID=UPI001262C4FA|nr:dynein assembly factor 1, axonemal homolog [Pistacia vera]